MGRTLSDWSRLWMERPGRRGVLSRPIALLALLAVASTSFMFVCLRRARSEETSGLEANYCYPTRSAALAAFGKGQTVTVEGQLTIERSGEVETFEILGRSSDNTAVLLNSLDDGGACILVQGRTSGPSVTITHTSSEFGSRARHAASPRSPAR